MQRVRRFGVIQTSNMAAMMYFVLAILFLLPFFFFASLIPDMSNEMGAEAAGFDTSFSVFSGIFLFFIPPIYAAIGWVTTAIMCWFYNLIAGFVGGIAIDLQLED